MYGELIPVGGGDPIPMLKKKLRIGRRESCDVVLRFANVSAYHCLLFVDQGYWFVKDLHSSNGVKVNGQKLTGDIRRRLDPADVLSVAKHQYEAHYSPVDLGAVGTPPDDEERPEYFLNRGLLERAGVKRREEKAKRYDVLDDRAGRMKKNDDDEIPEDLQ